MQDITKFVSQTDIKPELALVYITEVDGVKYVVATDSFRLVEYKLPDYFQEHMPAGYYTPKAWQAICKAYNKKKQDLTAVMHAINDEKLLQPKYENYTYPEYRRIIPTADRLEKFDGTLKFNREYFIDFLDLMPTTEGDHLCISFADIRQKDSAMITYANENITLLLMSIYK